MKKQLHYIGFYDLHDSLENRISSLAAVNKMDYIASVFINKGYKVNMLSCSYTLDKKMYKKSLQKVSPDINVIRFFTLGWTNKIYKILSILNINLSILLYLFRKVKKQDKIIIYHSLDILLLAFLVKLLFGSKVIFELEEIYSEVKSVNKCLGKIEKTVINANDKFILPTKKLTKVIPLESTYAIIHGIYKSKKSMRSLSFADNKKHIVYAGTFDKTKGVMDFIKCSKFLSEDYVLHVLGFGSEQEVINVKELIESLNNSSECQVIYEGIKKGDDFDCFLQKCDLGVSPQDANALYNSTSFPSKILTYLSNGLRVLTISIDTITESDLGEVLYYYEKNDSKYIAEKIKSIDFNSNYDSKQILLNLDFNFKKSLENI